MINNHGNADDFPPYPTQTLRKSNYQNISSNFEYLNNLNLEPNSNTRLSDDAQTTYLNEISELQKQNSVK
ncbi:unnamed protein product [Heterobilharzia americana]|nr:unnamed protein product [Heterobilharzia americana]